MAGSGLFMITNCRTFHTVRPDQVLGLDLVSAGKKMPRHRDSVLHKVVERENGRYRSVERRSSQRLLDQKCEAGRVYEGDTLSNNTQPVHYYEG